MRQSTRFLCFLFLAHENVSALLSRRPPGRAKAGLWHAPPILGTSLQAAPDTRPEVATPANPNLPTFPKTPAEEIFIQDSLRRKALFRSLPPTAIQALVSAFETTLYKRGDIICEQGDTSIDDYVYLVGPDSACTVTVDGVQVPEPYGTMEAGSIFGELGVFYRQTRKATISASTSPLTIIYRVAGHVFLRILHKPPEKLASMQEMDDAINQVSGTQALYGGDIIPPYQPERAWLWKQYAGTILNISLQTTVLNMVFCVAFCVWIKDLTGGGTDALWNVSDTIDNMKIVVVPDKSDPIIQRLSLIHEIWGYQRTLTTFVLTFFLNQAYTFWKQVYDLARSIQGRLNDFHLLLATNVARDDKGCLLPESEMLLDEIGQYSRLYHILMWASVAKRFSILMTPAGLDRMESRGLMTPRQLQILQKLDIPNDQLHTAPLEWMMIRVNQAMAAGILAGDTATKGQFLQSTMKVSSSYGSIQDKLAGRMPLAYAHLVQILVDTFVLAAPLALYSDLGDYSVIAVGIITLSFTGFLNLSKIFLDPLNNEGFWYVTHKPPVILFISPTKHFLYSPFSSNSIFMDLGVLIRESNAGSTRWKNSGAQLPL